MLSKSVIFKSKTIINKKLSELGFLELLLKNRNVKTEKFQEFLKPTYPNVLTLKDFKINPKQLKKAVERINKAIKNQENILIYGDYDVDGITSTAILWQTLYQLNAKVIPFIPDRQDDGYGIKAESFFNFQKEKNIKFSLLITVDNGIVANKEIQKIQDQGTEVIITDHHLPGDSLPPALAIVHSSLMAGCGVAWLLSTQFNKNADLGLAALGTVTDCMPLHGINRNIVTHGIQSLRLNPSPGIKKLITVSGAKQDSINTFDLGFLLGPRINAIGRLSNPNDALRLLCSANMLQAARFAQTLDTYNRDRQSLQQDSLDLAESTFNPKKDINDFIKNNKNKVLVVADKSFHPGIIGLIASNLTEKYYLPTIAISIEDKISKGSCRSIKELNIIESLRETSDLFVDVGGHAGAAGFSIETKNIEKFQKKITQIINQKLKDIDLKPSIIVDAQMELEAVTLKNYKIVKKLEPFGINNSEPLFYFKDLKIVNKKLVGSNGNHLKLKLDDPKTLITENVPARLNASAFGVDAIAFKKGDMDSKLKVGDLVDIIAGVDANTWQGITTPQLMVKEIIINS